MERGHYRAREQVQLQEHQPRTEERRINSRVTLGEHFLEEMVSHQGF